MAYEAGEQQVAAAGVVELKLVAESDLDSFHQEGKSADFIQSGRGGHRLAGQPREGA